MNIYSQKILFPCLLLTALILLSLTPALADNGYTSTVTAQWMDSNVSSQNISINDVHKLTYQLHANESEIGGNYIFTVKIDHHNITGWADDKTGFAITGYTTSDAYPEKILNVELRNGTELIYTLQDLTFISIDVIVQANASAVYPNEAADIHTTFSRYYESQEKQIGDGAFLKQIAANTSMQALCLYPTLPLNGQFELVNPTELPSGASEIDFNYLFYTDNQMNTLRTNGGLKLYNRNYTLDFSNVSITANGSTKTYAEWKNSSSGSPIEFQYPDGASLSKDHQLTYTNSSLQFFWRQTLPFKAVTNDGFSKYPQLNFTNMTAFGKIQFNNRGPAEEVKYGASVLNMTRHSGTFFSQEPNVQVRILPAAGNSSRYIIADSLNFNVYPNSTYQELFKGVITSRERNGTDHVKVTYEIPYDVTITHIKIPPSGNDETAYGNIKLVKGEQIYDLGNKGAFLDLVNNSITSLNGNESVLDLSNNSIAYSSGEAVVFELENVLKIKPDPGGQNSYSTNQTISFVGTTGGDIKIGDPLTFQVFTNEYKGSKNNFETYATKEYYMTAHMKTMPYIVADENNIAIETIEPEKPFYLYHGFTVPSYPYYSTHRTDIANASASGVFSSPVVYFSIPEGIVVPDFKPGVEIVDENGEPIKMTDLDGNFIEPEIKIFSDAGIYSNQLVEVKFVNPERHGVPFWVTGTYYVRLKVDLPTDYKGSEIIQIRPETVLLSSWDPDVIDTRTGGAGGRMFNLDNIFSGNHSLAGSQTGTYSSYLDTKQLTVISTEAVHVAVSVMTPTGNLTYTPGNEKTYPKLKAGSMNETFKMYFSNDLAEAAFSNATLYFVLPKAENWGTNLSKPPVLNVSGLNPGNYTVFYTTEPLEWDKIGNYTHDELEKLNWSQMNFSGNMAENKVDWANVSAVRCKMNLQGGEKLELQLPFELPKVNTGDGITYNMTARGQTAYYLNDSLQHPNTYTAAVMLIQSDPPVIAAASKNIPSEIKNERLDFINSSPNSTFWHTFYTFDDFTPNLEIKSVEIKFTPYVGESRTVLLSGNNSSQIRKENYTPQRQAGDGGTEPNLDYAVGFKWTILDESLVKNGIPGEYVITYTTHGDGDGQDTISSKEIVLTKNPNTINLSNNSTSVLWNTNLTPSDFKSLITGKDMNESINRSRLIYNSSTPDFDIHIPGIYQLEYIYTDIGNNQKSAFVNVSVLYNGTLSGTAIGNGMPVESFNFQINNKSVQTNESGGFDFSLTATESNPINVSYELSFDNSTIPPGLKKPSGIPGMSGIGSQVNADPNVSILFEPIAIQVFLTDPENGLIAVSLYKNSSEDALPLASKVNFSEPVLFQKEPNEGWFEAGNYSLLAELKPGYRVASGDFTEGNSILAVSTDFSIGNDDIKKTLEIEKAPLISGHVWNDLNRDSIRDAEEPGIASATVTLFNDGNGTLSQTATDEDGYYCFYGMDENANYRVQINMPWGFNRISEFKGDQRINGSENYSSASVTFNPELHHTNLDAGFYAEKSNSGGDGTGSAHIVPGGPMIGIEQEETVVNETDTGFTEPLDTVTETPFRFCSLLLFLLILICIAVAVKIYSKR